MLTITSGEGGKTLFYTYDAGWGIGSLASEPANAATLSIQGVVFQAKDDGTYLFKTTYPLDPLHKQGWDWVLDL